MGGIPTAPLGPSCSWQMAQGAGHAAALQERREVLGKGNFPLPDPGRQPPFPIPRLSCRRSALALIQRST